MYFKPCLPIADGEVSRANFQKFPMKKIEQQRLCAVSSLSVRPLSAAVALALLPAAFAVAADMQEVVVSATRYEQKLSDALADITVIDREQIERSGATSIEDVLAKVPGVQITRNGGAGNDTKVFLRGSESQHVAVYLNGIRIDAQNGSGGAQWETLSLNAIDRVEVLRGAAGAVYGSDAMAGAIQIFTHRGDQGWAPYVSAGLGSHGTKKGDAGFSGAHGAWDYAVNLSYADSQGFDARPGAGSTNRNPDKDDSVRRSANASVGLQISSDQRLDFTALTSDSDAGYDNRPQIDDRAIRTLDAYGLSWSNQWTADAQTRVSVSQTRSAYQTITTAASSSQTETLLRNYLISNELKSSLGVWTATLERREDQLENSSIVGSVKERSRQQNALGLGYGNRWNAHSLQLNVRYDRDSDFGNKNTASAAYGWDFATNWKATASVGTGFRTPTLYQRFSVYGTDRLKPEESLNKELGLRWADKDNSFSATLYRNEIKNLLKTDGDDKSCVNKSSCYENVRDARLEGLTLAGTWRTGGWKWHASVDFQNPHDKTTGRLIERRSKRFATLGAQTDWAGWILGGEAQAASKRFHDSKETTKSLDGYVLLNLSASRKIAKDLTLSASVDNALDRDYELVKAYATPGRTLWVGLKWMPQ